MVRTRLSFLSLAAILALAALGARADGLDRDTLLTDSPAAPAKGTVRITGGGSGQTSAVDGGNATGGLSASVAWTPFANFTADVGAYVESGDKQGPSARLRYQILSQAGIGVDLGAGVRLKTVGFHPDNGEIEFIVAVGRQFGQWDLMLNGVFGVELGTEANGEHGKDIEAKFFGGYRFTDAVRAGLDFRFQSEIELDEAGAVAVPTVGRDFNLKTGPALSWMLLKNLQLQALVGVAAPKFTDKVVPTGVLSAAFDF